MKIRSVRDITKIASAGTLFASTCNLYKLTVKDTGNSAIDLRDEDDAVNDASTPPKIAVETVEAIVRELNPMAYFTVNDASGVMYIVMDRNTTSDNESVDDIATRVNELQKRVRSIGKDTGASTTSIGPNDIDISGSTVEAATGMTFTV